MNERHEKRARLARPKMPTTPLRVLHVAMELAPWAVVGDVGEWLAGLARAQADAGDRVTVVLPRHGGDRWPRGRVQRVIGTDGMLRLAGQEYPFRLCRLRHDGGYEVILVESDLYNGPGIYEDPESGQLLETTLLRSSLLCHAALYYALNAGGRWQILHGHDHHGALLSALMGGRFQPTPLQHARTVLSVHDASYWGLHPIEDAPIAGLARADAEEGGPFHCAGSFSTLRAGLQQADRLHLVAPEQAREVLAYDGPAGPLAGDFEARAPQTVAIEPGFDPATEDPVTDGALAAGFSARDEAGRDACRQVLLAITGLPDRIGGEPTVLVGYAGPLLPERTLGVLAAAAEATLDLPAAFVVAGDGEPEARQALRAAAAEHPGRFWYTPVGDEELRRQVLAGIDLYALPAAHSPACRGALIAMRYGAVPVISESGPVSLVPRGVGFIHADGDAAGGLRDAIEAARKLAFGNRRKAALSAGSTWLECAARMRREIYQGSAP